MGRYSHREVRGNEGCSGPPFMDTDYLVECDCCHDYFDLQQIRIDPSGKWVYCDKCNSNWAINSIEEYATDNRATLEHNQDRLPDF